MPGETVGRNRSSNCYKTLEMPNGLARELDTTIRTSRRVCSAGTLPQHRVTKLAPKPTGAEELRSLFENSMELW